MEKWHGLRTVVKGNQLIFKEFNIMYFHALELNNTEQKRSQRKKQ
jgi:hypothetical protein